jgi:hypothetical protein
VTYIEKFSFLQGKNLKVRNKNDGDILFFANES